MMMPNRTWGLLAPALFVMVVFMVLPLLLAVGYSLMSSGVYGGVARPFTLEAYQHFLFERDFDDTLLFTSAYIGIIARSLLLAVLTCVICLVIGVPTAWYIVCRPARYKQLLILLVTLPFWINALIRTYCWVLILRDEGLLNFALRKLGLITAPIHFLYNDVAVLLGLVYTFLPFMILPIYSTLERVDPAVIEAAHDLYASRIETFKRIVWPLAKPGALAGALLVFAPALGSFLAPDLLGGGRRLLIGSLIQLEFTSGRDWPFGSALATILTAGILLGLLFQARKALGGKPV